MYVGLTYPLNIVQHTLSQIVEHRKLESLTTPDNIVWSTVTSCWANNVCQFWPQPNCLFYLTSTGSKSRLRWWCVCQPFRNTSGSPAGEGGGTSFTIAKNTIWYRWRGKWCKCFIAVSSETFLNLFESGDGRNLKFILFVWLTWYRPTDV